LKSKAEHREEVIRRRFSNITKVVHGNDYTLALLSDGTVRAFGHNYFGQLGNGSHINSGCEPTQVLSTEYLGRLKNITEIKAGSEHCIALRNDGIAFTWGCNYYGQLGNGCTSDAILAIPVTDGQGHILSDIFMVDAGHEYTVVLKKDGTVWVCGRNNHGQIGGGILVGIQEKTMTLTQVKGVNGIGVLSEIISIESQAHCIIAETADGRRFFWGLDEFGDITGAQKGIVKIPIKI